jgi:protein-disulfide isomerase
MKEGYQDIEESTQGGSRYVIPAAIMIAGLVIAGAILFSNSGPSSSSRVISGVSNTGQQASQPSPGTDSIENIKPVTSEDHIKGNPDAPVKVVEFSDTECPFCKRFHPTMQQIIRDYSGQVAWVYRHFPLDSIHPKARKEAQATECANELGGNNAFWAYTDRLFEITPSNNNLELSLLPQIAEDIGLNRSQFEKCLAGDARGGKYAQRIETDYQDAITSGGRGTPYNIVIAPNGKKFTINGAQPYSVVKSIIDLALRER